MVNSIPPTKRMLALFIPNAITGSAIFAGYLSIILTFRAEYDLAAAAIILASILDMFDGWAARALKSSTDFGVQFDSLADMVNYGVASAILYQFMYFESWGVIGIMLSFLPVLGAGIRLARFNVAADPDIPARYYVGLPTTIGALVLAGFVIFTNHMEHVLPIPQAAFMIAFISLLMVSNVQYEKSNILSLRYILKTRRVLTGLIILVSMVMIPQIAFFAWGMLYILVGVVQSAMRTFSRGNDKVKEAEIEDTW